MNNDATLVAEKKGHKVYITDESFPDAPTDPDEQLEFIQFEHWHPRYVFFGKRNLPYTTVCALADDAVTNGGHAILLSLYDHGAQIISAREFAGLPEGHKEFDTMPVGFAIVPADTVSHFKAEHRFDKALKFVARELEDWNAYHNGWVYYAYVVDPDGETVATDSNLFGDRQAVERAEELLNDYITRVYGPDLFEPTSS